MTRRESSPCPSKAPEERPGQSRLSCPRSSRRAVATDEKPVRTRRIESKRSSLYNLWSRHQYKEGQEQSRKTSPVLQKKPKQLRKYQSGSDESSQKDQVLMTYRADNSPGKCKEIKVSRMHEKTFQAGDLSAWSAPDRVNYPLCVLELLYLEQAVGEMKIIFVGFAVDTLELNSMWWVLKFTLLVRIATRPKRLQPTSWLVLVAIRRSQKTSKMSSLLQLIFMILAFVAMMSISYAHHHDGNNPFGEAADAAQDAVGDVANVL
ncbi:hypothetical protein TNCV_4624561 [Trichonephila clavipes]|nr:hypothetical protein TNCV_4624561 [Trichonephila clavipes]